MNKVLMEKKQDFLKDIQQDELSFDNQIEKTSQDDLNEQLEED